MSTQNYDVVVLGSGPAGEGAAMNAAKKGKRVAMVETMGVVGGNCTHKGTIPSKALRQAVKQIIQFNTNSMFRSIGEPRWFSFSQVLKSAERVIGKQVKSRTEFYGRNRVDLYFGHGRFIDQNHVEVEDNEGGIERLAFKDAVIATGSRPFRPSDIDFTHARVYDSDTILTLEHTPRTLIIYGAGVIGCEYASIFAGLGVKVDLIDSSDQLLGFVDSEISDALSYHLRSNNVVIRHCESYDRIEADEHNVSLYLKSGKRLRANALLWAAGRSGNTEDIGLEHLSVTVNNRGHVKVLDNYRTEHEGIYAAGDVVGWPSLASASYDQGRAASNEFLGIEDTYIVSDVPTGIYTIPEISSVGKTEKELTGEKVPYQVGRAFFKKTARAQITGDEVGMLKLIFHIDTLEILGVHCFGDQASEIVHIGQAIMKQKGSANSIEYFVNNTFNYPTMAEAYRVAALDGLNRVF